MAILTAGFLLIRSIYKKEKEFEKKREVEFADYDKVLSEAHIKAEHIVQDASEEATKLSREGDEFTKHVNQNLDTAFEEIIKKNLDLLTSSSQDFFTSYQSYLQSVKGKYEQELDTLITKTQALTEQDFLRLQEEIRQRTSSSQNGLSKQMEDEFTKTQMEIHEYKKHKLREVNDSIEKLIMKVAEEVLGQTISFAQHQQLILDAFEKAKKEGMFDT